MALLFAGNALASDSKKPPNIVIILADDLGYGDLSCQGAKDMRTPHLDALFKSSMRFSQFYANSCVCSPTRAALLSGRYPEFVGVPGVIRTHRNNSWGHLTKGAVLLPALLKQAGYHTGIVGKWHLGLSAPNIPTRRGVDHFHGFLGDMMDDYRTHRRHGINYMRLNEKTIDPKGHATDLFSQWAVDYIRDRAKTKQPFFLYLAYNAPHNPVQPPREFLKKVTQREKNISKKRAKLVALIEHMDAGIGQVIAALKQTGAYDNTIILFTSDNGGLLAAGANNGPLRDGKGSMYEGGVRVPMCAVWPKHIRAGSHCDEVALTMDLCPTACDVAGVKIKHKIEGVSLLPLLLGKKTALPKRNVFYIRREGGRYKGKTIHALRRGDWKLVQNMPGGKLELFNLQNDPREKQDLHKKEPAKFKEMAAILREHVRQGEMVPWQPPAEKKQPSKTSEVPPIKLILQAQVKAWNEGNIEKFMNHYWKSNQLTFSSSGKTTRGWTDTLANYRKRYPGRAKMGKLRFDSLEVTPLGQDAALVLGRWYLQRQDDELEGNFTLIFRRVRERWVIIHDHTSRLAK